MLTAGLPFASSYCDSADHAPATDEAHALLAPGASADTMADCSHLHENAEPSATYLDTPSMYQASSRWDATATNGSGLDWGDATTITWSIVPDGTPIGGYVGEAASGSNFVSFMSDIYGSVTGSTTQQPWFSIVESVFDRWSEVSGLNFLYEPHDDGAAISNRASDAPGATGVRGDIRIGGHAIDGASGTLAYNFYPDNGEMVVDTSDSFFRNTTDNSLRLRNVMAHELGHGIGLSHADPVNGTKLMESIANTSFDGPQHDDILAAHRLYGDVFESGSGNDTFHTAVDIGTLDGRQVTVGDSQTHRYASIDNAADVDYFQFTASAGTQLNASLTPIGHTYLQGSEGAATSTFSSQAQNNLAFRIYDAKGQLIAHADRHSSGQAETLTDVLLTAGGTYYVRIHGLQDAAQMYQLELSGSEPTAAGPANDAIDFRDHTFFKYGGSQDYAGTVTITDAGSSLHMTGNRWVMIDLPYTLTPDTVLSFDFTSSEEGDIHAVGFDSNSSISSGLAFQIFGTQDWGRDDFARYGAQNGVRHFEIPVGQFYTGRATSLVFVNDHDVADANAESVFSNVRIYESDATAANATQLEAKDDRIVVSEDSPTVAFDAIANDEQGNSAASVVAVSQGSAGGTVYIASDGRIHYRPAADFHGIETFTYTAQDAHGSSSANVIVNVQSKNDAPVASDNRTIVTSGHTYRFDVLNNDSTGVDSDESLRILSVGNTSAGGSVSTDGSSVTYTPAPGFTGTETFTYTINDGKPGSNATARVTVSVEPPAASGLSLRSYLSSFQNSQTQSQSASVAGSPVDSSQAANRLQSLHGQFGFHSLDSKTIQLLDHVFAALGR